ncbi:MAG: OmpA family protein [Alphaproteobacteria bacterium]|nr:OmpA family protein [Alphaproteobacteria bacterium]
MKTFARLTAIAVAASFLAACGTGEVANMSVKGGNFNKGLHSGYVKLANSEYDQTDLSSGDDFASRAKMAAMGKASAPEGISSRKLVPPHKGQLVSARARLVSALGKGAAKKAPGQAAKAQTSFDCWMEQAEENIQPKDIAACRKAFNAAMKRVEAALAPKKKAKKKKKKKGPQTTRYVVYFDFNSAKLNKAGMNAVDYTVSQIKKRAKISVTGYADRSGKSDYNSILATKRANAVIRALEKAGVKNDIAVAVFGEKNPAVNSGDGKRERLNRRVEISVKQ